jgi:hypothetical protein
MASCLPQCGTSLTARRAPSQADRREDQRMTNFRYVWNRPDPNAAKKANRMLGDIRAFVEDEFAGQLRYGLGPGEDVIGIIQIDTELLFRRQDVQPDTWSSRYRAGSRRSAGQSGYRAGEKNSMSASASASG